MPFGIALIDNSPKIRACRPGMVRPLSGTAFAWQSRRDREATLLLEAAPMSYRTMALTYHTFPADLSTVHLALVDALKRMGMRVLPGGSGEDGALRILASAWRRELQVECEPRASRETRVRVFTKEDVYFQENVAADLVAQATQLLEQRRRERSVRYATGDGASAAILSVQPGAVALAS